MHITHEAHYPCACALTSVPFSSHQTSKCLYFRLEAHISSKLDITLTPYKLTPWANNFFSARPKYCLNKPWAFPPIHLYLLEPRLPQPLPKNISLELQRDQKKVSIALKPPLESLSMDRRGQMKRLGHKINHSNTKWAGIIVHVNPSPLPNCHCPENPSALLQVLDNWWVEGVLFVCLNYTTLSHLNTSG